MSARIRLDRISLSVPLHVQPERHAGNWASMLLGAAFDPPRRVYAKLLKEISFEAHEGDRVAILGRNGAGKSTLLRVLNGVYPPSSGRLEVNGSRQALLNTSLGFNSEATVRENIFLRGTAMGLNPSDLRDQVDPILEFAGLQEKVNHRLRTLSSGQRLRLGFAISTSVQHDITLMDEWVAAGDAAFMAKATERMRDHMGGSKIVLLASHNISLVSRLCNKGIVLEAGRLVHKGDIASALKAYHALMGDLREGREPDLPDVDGAVRVYGRIARLVARQDDAVVLEGWCVDSEGRFPEELVVEAQGRHFSAQSVTRLKRPDLMQRFGLLDDDYGFRATFKLPGLGGAGDIGPVQVLASPRLDRLGTALQMAPEVVEQLDSNAFG